MRQLPGIMGRIVDLHAALGALNPHPETSGELTLEVADEHAPWNSGRWRVLAESGHITVESADSEPGVSLDIQALTQAYWGTPSLDWLRQADRLRVNQERDYALLSALLPPKTVVLLDEF